MRREIIEPLGLKSTGLGSQGFARERLVRDDGARLPGRHATFSWNSTYWQEFGSPAGGLFSTPEDFAVICALMLGGGKWGDVRLLSPATVRMMTSNRLDDLPDLPEPVRRTQPWGLGWRLNHLGTPDSWGDLLGRQRLRPHRLGGQRGLDGPADAGVLHPVHELPAGPGAVAAGAPVQRDRRVVLATGVDDANGTVWPTSFPA